MNALRDRRTYDWVSLMAPRDFVGRSTFLGPVMMTPAGTTASSRTEVLSVHESVGNALEHAELVIDAMPSSRPVVMRSQR
jgi:hypothetical protein